MEFISHVVATDGEAIGDLAEAADPLKEWSGFLAPGLDTNRVAALHALFTGDTLFDALDRYEPVLVTEDGEDEIVILQLADELLEVLVASDDESLEDMAGELAASEVFENDGVAPEEAFELLAALVDLARLAETQAQAVFVRLRLLGG